MSATSAGAARLFLAEHVMAVGALPSDGPVLDDLRAIRQRCARVASRARGALVRAVERESRLRVVVETDVDPGRERGVAVAALPGIELPAVSVAVTAPAVPRCAPVPRDHRGPVRDREDEVAMAAGAIGLGVRPAQEVRRSLRVIEPGDVERPRGLLVTGGAVASLDLRNELAPVSVLVAGLALSARAREAPHVSGWLREVARCARRRSMPSRQGVKLGMRGVCEGRRAEGILGMAVEAPLVLLPELAIVRVHVASLARVLPSPVALRRRIRIAFPEGAARGVAPLAGDAGVLEGEREPGRCVRLAGHYLRRGRPPGLLGQVAALARRRGQREVGRVVAFRAAGSADEIEGKRVRPPRALRVRKDVAAAALEPLVPSGEREALRVIEACSGPESVLPVAGCAVSREPVGMDVLVAGPALLPEAQEGPAAKDRREVLEREGLLELLVVTRLAEEGVVSAGEREVDVRVLEPPEGLSPPGELAHELEMRAVVLRMAARARGLAIAQDLMVVTSLTGDLLGDLLVAVEAPGCHPARSVAGHAPLELPEPLDGRVLHGQGSWMRGVGGE